MKIKWKLCVQTCLYRGLLLDQGTNFGNSQGPPRTGPRVDTRVSGGLEALVMDGSALAVQRAACRSEGDTPELRVPLGFPGAWRCQPWGLWPSRDSFWVINRCRSGDFSFLFLWKGYTQAKLQANWTEAYWDPVLGATFCCALSPRLWAAALRKLLCPWGQLCHPCF